MPLSRVGIVLLTLTTAIVHLGFYLPDPVGEVIYGLNALGYVGLLGLLYLPLRRLNPWRRLIRWALIGYAALTIAAYLLAGLLIRDWTVPLGPFTKLVEAALIGLLWWEDRRTTP
jgi:hypothetical protein